MLFHIFMPLSGDSFANFRTNFCTMCHLLYDRSQRYICIVVACVLRSVERLFDELSELACLALDPLQVTKSGMLTVTAECGCDAKSLFTLIYVRRSVFTADIIIIHIFITLLSHRRPQQSGFTPGRSTCDRIATLCNIAQRRQDFGHPTFAAFVDLRAAFDSLS